MLLYVQKEGKTRKIRVVKVSKMRFISLEKYKKLIIFALIRYAAEGIKDDIMHIVLKVNTYCNRN